MLLFDPSMTKIISQPESSSGCEGFNFRLRGSLSKELLFEKRHYKVRIKKVDEKCECIVIQPG